MLLHGDVVLVDEGGVRTRILSTMAIALFVVLVPNGAAGATEHTAMEGPRAAGLMPAAEAPPSPEPSPAAPVLQIGGLVLLLGGSVVVARSWVSPAEPV